MNNRHLKPHDFKPGDKVTVHSGIAHRNAYPGVVDRVTPTRVEVTYDASSTGGRKAIKKTFYGATGAEVGGFNSSPMLGKKVDEHEAFRESVIHGLRTQGWSKSDAEAEAADRVERLRQKEAGQ